MKGKCPGQVVVLDNLSSHKGGRVRELVESRGCELLFLPPYSPDLNPIEEAFSKVKGLLRRTGARTREALIEAMGQALDANNKPTSSNGDRFWELTGGIFRCAECGLRMRTNVTRKTTRCYYYLCRTHHQERDACPNRKAYRADKIEPDVWGLVSSILQNPERVRADLERMIEQEREGLRGDPERKMHAWLEKLAQIDSKRGRFQHLYTEGVIELEDLRARLAELEETRKVAKLELEALRSHRERIEQLEKDKDALLESYVNRAPEALGSLEPEERHQVY